MKNLTQEIMFIYGMTFLVSMFVALIIKLLAKAVERLPQEGVSISSMMAQAGKSVKLAIERNRKVARDFRNTPAGSNNELINFYHER